MNRPDLEIYHQLRDKAFSADNSFIADSPKVVNILLNTEIEVKSILCTKEYYDEFYELISLKEVPLVYVATKEQMQSIVGHKIHHNCMMHGIRPSETSLTQLGNNIIMLDAITSTENIGAIARSAAAIGLDGYLLASKSPHPYSRRALRVSMGHISKLNIHIYDDIFTTIEFLRASGYKIIAAEITSDAISLMKTEVPQKWVLLMGHEGKGLTQEVIDACDACVMIEMADEVRSFNVSVAASIIMHHFVNKTS